MDLWTMDRSIMYPGILVSHYDGTPTPLVSLYYAHYNIPLIY